jgi:CBS domain-containing protein
MDGHVTRYFGMATTVAQMLTGKGATIWSVAPDTSVTQAVELMDARDVGAVLVTSGKKLVGILSERDCARKVILQERVASETPVRQIMTSTVVCVRPEQSTEACMALMTEHRIRHLPVVEAGELVGVISMRDVVAAILSEHRYTIDQLETYITGGR